MGWQRRWVAAGQDPALFWALTPLEIDNIMTGCGERARREHNARMSQAWHTGAFSRSEYKLPKHDAVLDIGSKPDARRQSVQEMFANLRAHKLIYERNRSSCQP